jgi:ubiquinone/menaquinone biosynthesis C-methylase UbiE
MAQNIYDDPGFFAGYSQLRRSVHGLDGAPEWPAIRAVLPQVKGKRIVDLGCGFGWFARWAREQGAAHVTGFDLSENMIARAKAATADSAITYTIADLEQLDLPEASFDFAYSSLALHYVVDLGRLLRTIHRALTPASHFTFTIEHPIYMAPAKPGWIEIEGRKVWPVDSYAAEGPRVTNWLAEGVVKQHRTLGTTINALLTSGFAIRHVQEWSPTANDVTAKPALTDELERPMMVLISVER